MKFVHVPLEPEKYQYTRERGFTREWCEKFGVVHCLSGFYLDYMIIPIEDKEKGVQLFEARRLMEYEYLCKEFKSNEPLGVLRDKFKQLLKTDVDQGTPRRAYLKKRKVWPGGITWQFPLR